MRIIGLTKKQIDILPPFRATQKQYRAIYLHPSVNLAYIVGVLKGDGCVYMDNGRYRICLAVTDKVFSDSFKVALEKIGLKCFQKEYDINKYPSCQNYPNLLKTRWLIKATSKQLYLFYKNLDIEPFLNSDDMKIAFIKGFYESEGTCSKNSKLQTYRAISMTNTTKELLEMINTFLVQFHFHPKLKARKPPKPQRKQGYDIRIAGHNEVTRFLEMVQPCIKLGD